MGLRHTIRLTRHAADGGVCDDDAAAADAEAFGGQHATGCSSEWPLFVTERMAKSPRTQVIATRKLEVSGGASGTLTVRIGRPRRHGRGEWVCPFEVVGLGGRRSGAGHGVDSVQALIQAVEGARTQVLATGTRIVGTFCDEPAGLPRTVPSFFGRRFALSLNRMIDRKVERFARRAARNPGGGRGVSK